MISFRFHLVSVIAVFLALALGTVVGSTYIDQAIVDVLRDQLNEVRDDLDRLQADNDRLGEQVDDLGRYVEGSAPYAVDQRLVDDGVVVLAERGVDDGPVEDAVLLLRQAGARSPGILWLERSWALADEDQRTRLTDAVGVAEGTPETMRAEAMALLVDRLSSGVAGAEGLPRPDPLTALVDAGFIEFQVVGDVGTDISTLGGRASLSVLVSSLESDVGLGGSIMGMAQAMVDADVPTVVAESWQSRDGGPDRGNLSSMVRADEDLAERVSTVDDLDLPEGRVATALALDAVEEGVVGHFGYGPGAEQVLPDFSAR